MLRVAFCDPHGAVAQDAVATILPQSERGLIRALERLSAHALLWEDAGAREANARPLIDLLVRLASFVHSFRREVDPGIGMRGYDAIEEAFTFSFYPPEGGELWFQLTLREVERVAAGELHSLEARPAE